MENGMGELGRGGMVAGLREEDSLKCAWLRFSCMMAFHLSIASMSCPVPPSHWTRFDHVTRANKVNAVETLLVTDELFRCVQGNRANEPGWEWIPVHTHFLHSLTCTHTHAHTHSHAHTHTCTHTHTHTPFNACLCLDDDCTCGRQRKDIRIANSLLVAPSLWHTLQYQHTIDRAVTTPLACGVQVTRHS